MLRRRRESMHTDSGIEQFEMVAKELTLTCTLGKIVLWFGRSISLGRILQVLHAIARANPTAIYEVEFMCQYEKIAQYEAMGYVLISYARMKGCYRAMFNIPFSDAHAVRSLAELIVSELESLSTTKTLYWNANELAMKLLLDELKGIGNWEYQNIIYRKVRGE